MKLTDLNGRFLPTGGEGVTYHGAPAPLREGVALAFDCPCGCGTPLSVPFKVGLDGRPFVERGWDRTGDTLDTLTLSPSVLVHPEGRLWGARAGTGGCAADRSSASSRARGG